MKFAAKTFIAFSLACTLGASVAFATDPAPATPAPAKTMTPQQQKMSDCSASAKTQNLKGPDRKAFMSDCLKKDGNATPTTAAAPVTTPTAATAVTQQDKMKACNADPQAKTLKGDDRKKFMSACLSGTPAPATAPVPAAAH